MSPSTTRISIMLDTDLVAHYERLAGGKDYQTLINDALRISAGLPVPAKADAGARTEPESAPQEHGRDDRKAVFTALYAQQQEIEKLANQQQELFALMQGMFFPDNLAGAANMVSLGIEQLRHLSEGSAPAQILPASIETKE